ncbi:TatD family hydrolase [Candidatus Woesebacteria bacterium]|nr:TatD family hydrolase [Candidatus Woesebacteria bacterium]
MIIDTHCHYNLEPLYTETDLSQTAAHLSKALEHGIVHTLVPGTDALSSERALALTETYPQLWAAIGFHPHEAHTLQDGEVAHHLDALLKDHPAARCLAIGETGLDYFRLSEDQTLERQKQQSVFAEHIVYADAHQLPLSIHVRDTGTQAYDAVISLIKSEKRSNLPFILHCASGTRAYISAALELGAYISLAGNVTYKTADALREIARIVPKERVLVETDAPFLTPQDYRGKNCEPWMIQLTVAALTHTCGITDEQLYTNTCTLFPSMKAS